MRPSTSTYRQHILYCFLLCACATTAAPCAFAQSYGYGFVGATIGDQTPGNGAFRYGIGGSWAVIPRVALGGDVGGIRDGGSGVIASGNLSLHLRGRVESGFDPFFTGGITGARFGRETGVYGNIGGGMNYWVRPRLGVRVEFRGYPGGEDLNSFSEFRFGISFR
jgi:hypothetical protein